MASTKFKYGIVSAFILLFVNASIAQVTQVRLNDNWQFTRADSTEWRSADVPGCVHTDLLNHDLIEDPFYRVNERNQQWIGKKDWIYKTTFDVESEVLSNQNVEMVFKGLDTYANVYLNDSLVLSADNMHRTWRVDARELLDEQDNHLRIYFYSAMKKGLELKEEAPIPFFQFPNNDQIEADKRISTLVRKAGYHFGWDWGPRFVTAGIWRDVAIEAWSDAKLDGVQVMTKAIDDEKATMVAVAEVKSEKQQQGTLQMNFGEEFQLNKTVQLEKGLNKFVEEFTIDDPELWWSNGLGEPHLYDFSAGLALNGELVDKEKFRTGIRTIEVVTEDDEHGKSFYVELNGTPVFLVEVNGHPVFMKGANYIPNDNFLNRVSDEKYEYILQSAADANMNMIRVWGGGVFEKDIFYELCDELGLLVWQDMLFACGTYPGYDSFLESVAREVKDNVKRIRNHPSLALYCGNNEVEVAYYQWDWQKALDEEQQEIQEEYMQNLFYETIPQSINSVDTTRYYHPTSPITGYNGKSHLMGDMHDWSVWHGKEPFETYNENVPRFMSEYGFQSYPELSTVKTFTKEEDRTLDSEVMKAHQRCMSDDLKDKGYGNRLIKHYMDQYYHEPKDFESYLYVSQLVQAKGVKMAVEAHRRNMPLNMGTLYWQLNDCWPVASWSSIDYEGNWKALHYTIRDMYKEFLVSPIVEDEKFRVYVVSDRLSPTNATLKLSIKDLSGEETYFSESLDVNVEGNDSELMFEKEVEKLLEGRDATDLVCEVELMADEVNLAGNIFHFVPEKELQLTEPGIETEVQKQNGGYEIKLTTEHMAKGVFISAPGVDGTYSDNYFDLLPGESKTVRFSPSDATLITGNPFEVASLFDTY